MSKYLETRITKIEKVDDTFKVFVDVYECGLISDEFVYRGYIIYDYITQYDSKKSVKLVKKIK